MAGEINFGILDQSIPARAGNAFYAAQQNALASQQAQAQNKLMQYQMQKAQRADEEEQAFRNALAGADTSSTASLRSALPGLMKVSPTQAMALQKNISEQEKSAREADKSRLENSLKTLEIAGQLASGVKDQASLDAARAKAADLLGPEFAAKMPSTYDPKAIEQGRMQAMTVKDQLANEWKAKGYDLDVAKFGESQRHNRVEEGISGGNLAVSRANLGMRQAEFGKGKYDAERGVIVDERTGIARPVTTSDGSMIAPKGKAPTEFQGKSAAYGARAEQADKIISELGDSYSPMAINAKQSAGKVPVVGGALEAAANKALGVNSQKAEQAQRDFINAVLRQESGAAISAPEFENAKRQYFPQPGDSSEVITQKAKNRQLAIQGFKNSAAGAAFTPTPAASTLPGGWSVTEK